ncbi:hypothetical protein V6Z11_D12G069000 [Gossypium hirsutum]
MFFCFLHVKQLLYFAGSFFFFWFSSVMGCSSSKLDDLPAVALCRERCSFLDEAIQQGVLPRSPPSPNKLKSKAVDPIQVGSSSPKKDVISHHHSHSHSGSHLHFDSGSDEDDSVF